MSQNIINNNCQIKQFSSYLSANTLGVTGNGSPYPLRCDTAPINNDSIYSAFSGQVTWGEACMVQFEANIGLSGLVAANTSGFVYLESINVLTPIAKCNPYALADTTGALTINATICFPVLTLNPYRLVIEVYGNATQNVVIVGGITQYTLYATSFSGFKIF